MTHPTDAGERERLARWLEDEAVTREEVAVGHVGGQHNRELSEARDFRRAADLLRTEPGGEAVARIQVKDRVIQDISKLGPPEWVPPDGEYLILPVGPTTPVEPDLPKIVCLCGSTRFYREYQIANYHETMKGHIVLSVGFYPHSEEHHEEVGLTNAGYPLSKKEELDELHLRKIDLAEEVLVIDVDGYIGESTRREIGYAEGQLMHVRYWSEEPALSNAPVEEREPE